MKLLFIRHGDPDYTIDSLTECSYAVKKQKQTDSNHCYSEAIGTW